HEIAPGFEATVAENDRPRIGRIRETLNDVASQLENNGFDVIRSPMFVQGGTFYSYTNSLPVNGNMIIPSYAKTIEKARSVWEKNCQGLSLGANFDKQVIPSTTQQGCDKLK